MDQTTILYISLIISLLSLGVSVYALFKPRVEKVTEVVTVVKEVEKPVKEKPVKEKKTEPEPKIVPVAVVDIPEEKIVEAPKVDVTVVPEKVEKIRPVPVGVLTNTWYLEVSGPEGKEYNIHIEWSDGSSDIESGVVPEEETFIHKKGVVPVKVVGIAPNGDQGLSYLWELNGFHWS